MRDPLANALGKFHHLELPPTDIKDVKRRARPQIWLRRAFASAAVMLGVAAVPNVTDLAEDLLGSTRPHVRPQAPTASGLVTPGPSHSEAPCDIPILQPTYLPWARDPTGIPPTRVSAGPDASSATWLRGNQTEDHMHLGKIPYSGAKGRRAPALPDGTSGSLHHDPDNSDPVEIPFGATTREVRWSINWSTRFTDGCRSLHLVVFVEGLSAAQERQELIKIARSLIEPSG